MDACFGLKCSSAVGRCSCAGHQGYTPILAHTMSPGLYWCATAAAAPCALPGRRCPDPDGLAGCLGLAGAGGCRARGAPAGCLAAPAVLPATPLASCCRCCRLRGAPGMGRICCTAVAGPCPPWKLEDRARLAGTPPWELDTAVGSRCRPPGCPSPPPAAPLAARLRCPVSPAAWLAGRFLLAGCSAGVPPLPPAMGGADRCRTPWPLVAWLGA